VIDSPNLRANYFLVQQHASPDRRGLWEQYGRPDGGEEEFWLKAEREIKQAKGLTRTIPEPSKTASERQEKASQRKNNTL
jgi:hypothetical protein